MSKRNAVTVCCGTKLLEKGAYAVQKTIVSGCFTFMALFLLPTHAWQQKLPEAASPLWHFEAGG